VLNVKGKKIPLQV